MTCLGPLCSVQLHVLHHHPRSACQLPYRLQLQISHLVAKLGELRLGFRADLGVLLRIGELPLGDLLAVVVGLALDLSLLLQPEFVSALTL